MSTPTPQRRQDHDTTPVYAALALLLATLPWHAATAQTAVPCTAIENDAERLACYDRALRGTPPAAAEQAAPSRPAVAAPLAAPPAAAAVEPRRERRIRESTAPTAPAAPAAPVAGRSDNVIVPLVIVSVRALPSRDTLFTADDGSTWVQTDSQRIVALPDTPFDAELKSGAIGSYFLVPKGGARAIRVRAAR